MFERHSVSLFLLVWLIMYVIIFLVIDKTHPSIARLQYICFAKCNNDSCKWRNSTFRDKDYWLDVNGKNYLNPVECNLTTYEFGHFLFHIWLSYEFGFIPSIVSGIICELFEHYFYNCGSYLDLFWNTLGAIIGLIIKSICKKYNKY